MTEHLLPPNSATFERAAAGAIGRLSAVPTPIEPVWRPWDCPVELLPWLAWALSVDVWNDDWTEQRKRHVLARAFALHRLKGTAEGLRRHVRLMDARVKQLVVPPQGTFASRTLTKDEMDQWLRKMPQIRVYLAHEIGSAFGLSFENASGITVAGSVHGFWGYMFARFDAGRALYGRAARLWDRGEEIRLRLVDLTTDREERQALRIERVALPGKAGRGLFAGRFADVHFAGHFESAARVVTYRQNVTYEHSVSSLSMHSAHPGLEPVDVRSERLSDNGHAGPYAFARRFAGQTFVRPDDAAWLMNDRVVLHDPSRAAPRVDAWSFADVSRLGISDYTAKGVIDLQDRLHLRAFVAGGFSAPAFVLPEDKRKQTNARHAVRASKAARDRVFVTHKLTRPRTLSDGIPLDGSFSFGGRVSFRL